MQALLCLVWIKFTMTIAILDCSATTRNRPLETKLTNQNEITNDGAFFNRINNVKE